MILMMYVVTKNGTKIRLNDDDVKKAVAEDEFGCLNIRDNVAVCNEADYMKKIWIVTVESDKKYYERHRYKGEIDTEFVAEMKLDHEPTQEELLYVCGAFGNGQQTILRVDIGYIWDTEWND